MTQDQAMAILESGQSVLLTGAAGTGKTHTLRRFIERSRQDGKHVAVTATTGLAATHLQGSTIHAWSGIGVHEELRPAILQRMSQSRRDLIKKADILVIDEISMFHDFRLDMIDEILRSVRSDSMPFGGLQVVLCGDFFQLPPVIRSDSRSGGFITSAKVWSEDNFVTCYLEEQFRQADDKEYADILNGIRTGFLTRSQLNRLQSRTEIFDDPFELKTRLLTTNADVDTINHAYLQAVDGEEREYEMQHAGTKRFVEQLKKSCLASEQLRLKVGARVMFIKNSAEKKYVNGSLGTVLGFDSTNGFPVVKLSHGREIEVKPEIWELVDGDKKRASLYQLPLRLAWAITVHKSQGMTLDAARIDLRRAFVEGMGYVALSRVKNIDSLQLDGLNGMALRVSPQAKEIDVDLRKRSKRAEQRYATAYSIWLENEKDRKSKAAIVPPVAAASKSNWSDKINEIRKIYPNAYRPWTRKDDEKLRVDFLAGATVDDLSEVFGRHVGAVSIRLRKQFGDNVTLKHRESKHSQD